MINHNQKIRTLNKGLCMAACLILIFKFGEESAVSGLLICFMFTFLIINDFKMQHSSFKKQMSSLASSAAIAGLISALYLQVFPVLGTDFDYEKGVIIIFVSTFLFEFNIFIMTFIFTKIVKTFNGGSSNEGKV